MTAIGSSPLGFRTAGTPEDEAVAVFVADEMRAMGLWNVAIETVEVDAWRFHSASLTVPGSSADPPISYRAVSFGGVPATPETGITARLVDIGDGRRRLTDVLDLAGALVLLDWRRDAVPPSAVVLELTERGVVGVVVNCPTGAAWYQSPHALGAFDGNWPLDAPPMILISAQDAAALRASNPTAPVTLTLEATLHPGAAGSNVVGYLVGDLPGPIVVGAHHDAWFQGAFDNASGVAAMLAIAKALTHTGFRPSHTICFTSRTAEEFGLIGSTFDWCIGAWRQVTDTHPDWSTTTPFHLCVEATGHPELRSVVEAPVELQTWARRVCRAAEKQGWTPTGWRVAPPVAGTEQWPFLIAGIPGVACYAWEKTFGATDYHTQFDTVELLDFRILAAQTRMYALLLLCADSDPDVILDHAARARQLTRIATETEHLGLAAAARQHAAARGRTAFTQIGTSQFALDAHGQVCHPHRQSLLDLREIELAIAVLGDKPDAAARKAAARHIQKVGSHFLFPYLGYRAFRHYNGRLTAAALARTWGGRSHLTTSPDLWQHIASLVGEAGAREFGPWVRADLMRAQTATRQRLAQRLDDMAHSVNPDGP